MGRRGAKKRKVRTSGNGDGSSVGGNDGSAPRETEDEYILVEFDEDPRLKSGDVLKLNLSNRSSMTRKKRLKTVAEHLVPTAREADAISGVEGEAGKGKVTMAADTALALPLTLVDLLVSLETPGGQRYINDDGPSSYRHGINATIGTTAVFKVDATAEDGENDDDDGSGGLRPYALVNPDHCLSVGVASPTISSST